MVDTSKIATPLKAARRILALLWASSRRWAVLGAAASVAEIVFGLLTLYLIKGLVDAVTGASAATAGQLDIGPVVHAVVLTAAGVQAPTRVRFAWHKLAEPNLVNRAGLPASAFRAGQPARASAPPSRRPSPPPRPA